MRGWLDLLFAWLEFKPRRRLRHTERLEEMDKMDHGEEMERNSGRRKVSDKARDVCRRLRWPKGCRPRDWRPNR